MSWQDPEAANEAARYASPIPSRTLIAQILEKAGRAMSHGELVQQFELHDPEAIEALSRRLGAMVRDSQLVPTDDYPPCYRPIRDDDVMIGKVQSHPQGFGFVVVDGLPDLSLNEREMRLAFHGDTVRVRAIGSDRRGRLQGKIVEVIKHQQQELIGRVELQDGHYYIQPNQPNTHQPVAMEPEQIAAAKLALGDFARIAIDEWPTRDEYANGHIVKPLSDFVDTQLIIPATLLDYDIPHVFSDEVIAEAEKYKEPSAKDRKGRIDLRDLPLVTIDGEDARDFDDAVYAEKRAGGGYRLVVAIADVSHYVKLGSALDEEAQARGTSVYFPNHVVPMLPEALSNGLCSLNPHLDRLCMVCDLTLSRQGRVTGYQFYPSVMHSQARLTYSQVAQYLAGETDAIPDNKDIHKSINTLFSLFHTMLEVRSARGAMEFETTETYMTFDDLGAIADIKPRTRNDAHRLIEECMLLANVCAADYALGHDLPVLYRNHEAPQSNKVQKVRDFVRLLGLDFPEKPTQADYQRIIEATRERIDAPSIHSVLLRSMMQAFYGPDNLGHYGLAYESYTHFTSPIRRYPDLLLHRAIKAHVTGQAQPMDQSELDQAGQHYSQTERRADEASRSVMSWLKCHYMRQHLGDEFDGIVTAVMEFGLFITLTDLYVDGLVHVRHMGDDYFAFDAGSQTLNGQNHGQRFGLGDKVRIKVAGVNLDDRKIDFELIRQLSSQGRAVRGRAPRVNGDAPPPKTARRGSANSKRTRAKPVTTEPVIVSTPVEVEAVVVATPNSTAPVKTKPRKDKAKKPKTAKDKASKKAKEKKRKANAKRKAE